MDLQLHEVAVERMIAGRRLRLSTGMVAKQAAGACLVQYEDTIVLTAVTSAPGRRGSDEEDFFPLTVDYREKTYAAGKFPGGFFKREKAPSTKETLTMRLTDRPIRPLFPKGFTDEVVIQSVVLSCDMQNDPDILSIIGASAALSLSPLPFEGPIGACRVGRKNGTFVINPTHNDLKESTLNLVLAGTTESITMVEASAKELPEDVMVEALLCGHTVAREVAEMIRELVAKAGPKEKMRVVPPPIPACLDAVREAARDRIRVAVCTPGKIRRRDAVKALRDEIVTRMAKPLEEGGPTEEEVARAFDLVRVEVVRGLIREGKRIDGRDLTTIRPIDCRVGLLPCVHGSALFTRGETQALCAVTLGTAEDSQKVDGLHEEYYETWYLHYQAPGFSVGEAKVPRGPGRRDIGHGMLAQRALAAVMPHEDGFPYTVRAVSEILEMNGSSSMATVCAATLALMDAGVPIKKPVAGIAMGLLQEEGEEPIILSDILGDEDHYGDMDFKVCGTRDGVTALQMDIKVKGISAETMKKALAQAREGRMLILDKIESCLRAPRPQINPRAPRVHAMTVDTDLIGKLIGPGGKTIRAIQEESRAKIDIEDDGSITIFAPDDESLQLAKEKIENLVAIPEIGKIYEGPVTSVRDFGAFVEILPGTEGLCHISELTDKYVEDIYEIVKVGDRLKVKVIDIDAIGKIRLSRKAVIYEERGETPPETPPRRGGSSSGDRDRGERGEREERGERGGGRPPRRGERGDRRG